MFKKSSEIGQLNMFTSPKSLFSGNSLKMYEDEQAWHNQFRKQDTMRIDETIFRPLLLSGQRYSQCACSHTDCYDGT